MELGDLVAVVLCLVTVADYVVVLSQAFLLACGVLLLAYLVVSRDPSAGRRARACALAIPALGVLYEVVRR